MEVAPRHLEYEHLNAAAALRAKAFSVGATRRQRATRQSFQLERTLPRRAALIARRAAAGVTNGIDGRFARRFHGRQGCRAAPRSPLHSSYSAIGGRAHDRHRVHKLVGCSAPIQQAGKGSVSPPELAAAVSVAGGLGMLGTARAGLTPASLDLLLDHMRALTARPFGANVLVSPGAPARSSWSSAARCRMRQDVRARGAGGADREAGPASARLAEEAHHDLADGQCRPEFRGEQAARQQADVRNGTSPLRLCGTPTCLTGLHAQLF